MVDKDKDSVVVARRNRTKIKEFKIQDSTAAKSSLQILLAIVSGRSVCQMWVNLSGVKLLTNSLSSKGETSFVCVLLKTYKQDPKQNISRRSHLGGGGGGGGLPCNRLMGMCRWMGSHFHDWNDYNGVEFSIELLEWGRTFFDFRGKTVLYNYG